MAFARSGWNPIGGQSKKGNSPAMWSYTSTDAHTAIRAAGYFNNVSDDVTVGDIIYSWASTGGTATAGQGNDGGDSDNNTGSGGGGAGAVWCPN